MIAIMPKRSKRKSKVTRAWTEVVTWIDKIIQVEHTNSADVISPLLVDPIYERYRAALKKERTASAELEAKAEKEKLAADAKIAEVEAQRKEGAKFKRVQ